RAFDLKAWNNPDGHAANLEKLLLPFLPYNTAGTANPVRTRNPMINLSRDKNGHSSEPAY
ncbi:MAG TPA: hypothetical protein QF556_00455, partial [Rhodospirillales bacterium]|nr:hypothetical protein [Rhodospirillales bacterium]